MGKVLNKTLEKISSFAFCCVLGNFNHHRQKPKNKSMAGWKKIRIFHHLMVFPALHLHLIWGFPASHV